MHKDDALRVLDALALFWEWHSTIDYLKTPPKSYPAPAVDLFGELENVRGKVEKGQYNEIGFQEAVRRVALSARDGHLDLVMDALGIFTFSRAQIGEIVSVSADGKSYPEIYLYRRFFFFVANLINMCLLDTDIRYHIGELKEEENGRKASPIKTVDGEDVQEFLQKLSFYSKKQNPDAMFNELLFTLPNGIQGKYGVFYSETAVYTGPSTVLEFKDGSKKEFQNLATFQSSFANITDGESFYQHFCSGKRPQAPQTPQMKKRDVFRAAPLEPESPLITRDDKPVRPEYPKPVTEAKTGEVAGYFLDGEYQDTAVLSLTSFIESSEPAAPREFQNVLSEFLDACRKAGKKKLVIDVTANNGGTIFLGYEAYKQLFPKAPIDDSANLRAHEQVNLMGERVQNVVKDSGQASMAVATLKNSVLDVNSYTTVDNKKWKNWEELYGPKKAGDGYNLTDIARWDFNNEDMSLSNGGGIYITGYADRKNVAPQPFKAENIVLLSRGDCGSTCAVFANLVMKRGVKTIVAGGLPQDSPKEAVGGTRGAQVFTLSAIYSMSRDLFQQFSSDQDRQQWKGTKLAQIVEKGEYLVNRCLGNGEKSKINLKNSIDVNDESRTPLQFGFYPANFHFWLTKDMVFDMTALWKKAANVIWGSAQNPPSSTE